MLLYLATDASLVYLMFCVVAYIHSYGFIFVYHIVLIPRGRSYHCGGLVLNIEILKLKLYFTKFVLYLLSISLHNKQNKSIFKKNMLPKYP